MKLYFQKNCRGITLIELMIALVIGAVLMTGLFTAFISQHRSYTVQDQISTVQQSVRAGMNLMLREIRMAGFNPTLSPVTGWLPSPSPWFGILATSADSITISTDLNKDGNLNQGEAVTYSIGDFDGDGDDDLLRQEVNVTTTTTSPQLVIENVVNGVTSINNPLFAYDILADGRMDDINSGLAAVKDGDTDGDSIPDYDPNNPTANWDRGEMIITPNPDDYYNTNNLGDLNGDGVINDADKQFFRDAIRNVIITLVVRTEMEDANYPGGLNIRGTAADGTCRTRTLSTRVRLRNLGLGLAPGSAVVE